MTDSRRANVVPLEPKNNAVNSTAARSDDSANNAFQGVGLGIPDKPDNLQPDESTFWDQITKKLLAAGIVAEVDLSALHRYVVSYCEWRRWNNQCQENFGLGSIQTYTTGAQAMSVYAVLRKQAAEELRKLEHQFGLTPRARQTIKVENPDQGSLDL